VNPVPAGLWSQLEPARPKGDELVGRPALPDVTPRLLAAIDAAGRRHLLIALDPTDEGFRDAGSRGLTAETEELILPGHEHARYIMLKCHDAAGHDMLDVIGGEIAEWLRDGVAAPAGIVSSVLARWRRFWAQQHRQMLSREGQIGLFAELWFLAYWLTPAVGALEALRRWRGPHGARHDFEHPSLSIESKGGSSTRGRIFRVNGLHQLDPPDSGRLLLFGLRLREEAGAGNTLPLLVEVCRGLVEGRSEAGDLLHGALIAAGYADPHRDEYEKIRWRVVEQLLFEVRDDFPRIGSGVFTNGVPAGVEELDYSINLGTFDHLVVSRRPADALELLRY
jgi:hypothetical protein